MKYPRKIPQLLGHHAIEFASGASTGTACTEAGSTSTPDAAEDGCAVGRKMEKTVPLAPKRCLLHTLTLPPCRSTSCATTHMPSPVPVSGLVVKNGSKMRRIVARSIPTPESQIVTRIPSTVRLRQL